MGAVTDYDELALFYDRIMGDASPRSRRILDALDRFGPSPESLLELGCGTGSVLEGLTSIPRLVGLDVSAAMLAIAARKVPTAELVQGDMADFDLDETFDAIACVYDSINHLSNFGLWEALFRKVAKHLKSGGLFIFDLNTIGRLRILVESPPAIQEFNGSTLITNVTSEDGFLTTWDLKVFAPAGDGHFALHHERISELGVALQTVRLSLADHFELLHEEDTTGSDPNDASQRAYFIFRRR